MRLDFIVASSAGYDRDGHTTRYDDEGVFNLCTRMLGKCQFAVKLRIGKTSNDSVDVVEAIPGNIGWAQVGA